MFYWIMPSNSFVVQNGSRRRFNHLIQNGSPQQPGLAQGIQATSHSQGSS